MLWLMKKNSKLMAQRVFLFCYTVEKNCVPILERVFKIETNPNQNRKKPHLAWIYSDNFFIQPHGLVWFGLQFLFYQPNQTKLQHKKTLIKSMSHKLINTHRNIMEIIIQ